MDWTQIYHSLIELINKITNSGIWSQLLVILKALVNFLIVVLEALVTFLKTLVQ
ncbi:MAG: hypothetical protein QG648_42 [Patescibacteria group bacterium]|nr:hypothetical protein [Patescibacteria group bacterium]